MELRARKPRKLEIYWFTVSYRQLTFWILAISLVAGLGGFAVFKDFVVRRFNQFVDDETSTKKASAKRYGHFSGIVGTVKVKKYDSVQWVNADQSTLLEEADYIQTFSDSFASIVFPDGTTYRMKQDSLIVVQENSEDPQTLAKKVKVRVSSGAVDLSTARREVNNSTAAVSAAMATALVNPESRMAVESNPDKKTAQFSVQRGSARVTKGDESIQIGAYERVVAEPAHLIKEKVLAPPDLLAPNNIKPVLAKEGVSTKIPFTWTGVPEAAAYRFRLSNSSVFSKVLKEEVIRGGTRYTLSGLEEGTYYWAVSSIDAKGQTSRESEPNKFTLINKSSKESDIYLTVQIIRISNIFEIIGRTDPGVSILINDEPVTLMEADGSFKHFTSPLPHKGKNVITITAQDRSGNSKTITKEVYVD
ncbi:MAG: FecR domain-containing protein [Terriglobia bacterium]